MEQWKLKERHERVVGGLDVKELTGLEIGPGCYPRLLKEDVPRLFYVDHASQEELREKYKSDPAVECDKIPSIDYVVKDGDLAKAVASHGPYDFVCAAHVIEHVPDLISWLIDVHRSLRNGCTLMLAVPDKRFTFDIFRQTTTAKRVKEAYLERRTRPDLKCIMDCLLNVVDANAWLLWDDYSKVGTLEPMYRADTIEAVAANYATGKYIDTHCWVFTPWSLLSLLGELVSEGHFQFDCTYFLTTQHHDLEFYLHLTKTSHSKTNWAEMAKRARKEALWPEKRLEAALAANGRIELMPE